MSYFIIKPNDDKNNNAKDLLINNAINDTTYLKKYLYNVKFDSLQYAFPYEDYIKSERYKYPDAIKNDLSFLNAMYPQNISSSDNIKPLYYLMTDSLFKKIGKNYDVFSTDEYIKLFNWAECFYYISIYDPQNKMLFFNVSDYWYQFIVKKMTEISYQKPEINFDFEYRYLQCQLNEKKYYFSTKVSSKEKFMYNLIGNNWAHLYQASWNQTSKVQKLLFLFILLFISFSFVTTFVTFYNKWFKK